MQLIPLLQDSSPSVSDVDFLQLESELGFKLPEVYKEFLRVHNGGCFRDYVVSGDMLISNFFSMNSVYSGNDLLWNYRTLDQLPRKLLPIADDGLGNAICLDCQSAQASVVIFDHEAGKSCIVAKNLNQFLAAIRYDDEQDWDESKQPFVAAERGDINYLQTMPAPMLGIMNKNKRTALAVAAASCRPEAVQLLLKRGAAVDPVDNRGKTPLLHAASRNAFDVCNLLLSQGADIDIRDNDKQTPLIAALCYGGCRVAVLLIESGADTQVEDCFGNTPLSLCQNNRLNKECVEPLLLYREKRDAGPYNESD